VRLEKGTFESEAQKLYPLPDDYVTSVEKENNVRFTVEEYDGCTEMDLGVRFRRIKHNIGFYTDAFNNYLSVLRTNFDNTGKYSFEDVLAVFKLVAGLRCGLYDVNPYISIQHWEKDNSNFLLVNNTGIFSINSFMYAYINGVTLFGLPSDISNFDDNTGCPLKFFEHDVTHAATLPYEEDNLSVVYYSVLNNPHLTKQVKEELLFTMWYMFHETPVEQYIYTEDIFSEPLEDARLIIRDVSDITINLKEFIPTLENNKNLEFLIYQYYNYAGMALGYITDPSQYLTPE